MLKIELTNTSAGLTAIQRAIAGDDITFTKLVIGDGVIINPDISNLTNVVNEIKHFPLGVVKPEDEEMLRVRSNINNVGLTEDKIIREYGLFAKFGSEQEFLFAYLNSGESTTPLPKASGGRYDLNRDFVLYAGNSNNVVFDTNGDLVYATLNDIKAMDAKKENVFSKNTGFNLNKSDLTENDSNKVFTPKGALDLKNWIVTAYTNAINTVKDNLTNLINGKLGHGGYDGTGKALFDLIKSNLSKLENLERDKFNNQIDLPNGLPTAESILNLPAGIYKISNKPIFELYTGYFTIQRLNSKNQTGDSTIIVYRAGLGNTFWLSSFNSNNWTGWKEFNHCPHHIGDFFFTSSAGNPALRWHGTSWEPVEGRMLIGTNSSLTLGKIGGSSQIKLTQGQLPAHRFRVESFSLGRGNMNISGSLGSPTKEGTPYGNGAFRVTSSSTSGRAAGSGNGAVSWDFEASRSWTGTTTSASPYTNSIGNGDNIDILNPYLAVKIWKRIG